MGGERSVSNVRGGNGRRTGGNERTEEDSMFMKQAVNNNILLKRDAESFFTGEKESGANFVRNYNEFYRGYVSF